MKIKKNIALSVDRACVLTDFLAEKLPDLSKKDIKALLAHKSVVVNGIIRSKYDFPLKKGQNVIIDYCNKYEFLRSNKLEIIYEDDYLIALNKPEGLLSVASDDKSLPTVFTLLNKYIRLSDSKGRIFIVHRLDRDTSGVIVAAKNETFKNKLQDNWNELAISRKYYALVEGIPEKKTRIIKQNLIQNKNLTVYGSKNQEGETAVTEYTVIRESTDNALLDVSIKTGKKNQIRAAMRDMRNSIVGDRKYGAKTNPIRRLGLHAYLLELKNPETGFIYKFEAKIPKEFGALFKENTI